MTYRRTEWRVGDGFRVDLDWGDPPRSSYVTVRVEAIDPARERPMHLRIVSGLPARANAAHWYRAALPPTADDWEGDPRDWVPADPAGNELRVLGAGDVFMAAVDERHPEVQYWVRVELMRVAAIGGRYRFRVGNIAGVVNGSHTPAFIPARPNTRGPKTDEEYRGDQPRWLAPRPHQWTNVADFLPEDRAQLSAWNAALDRL